MVPNREGRTVLIFNDCYIIPVDVSALWISTYLSWNGRQPYPQRLPMQTIQGFPFLGRCYTGDGPGPIWGLAMWGSRGSSLPPPNFHNKRPSGAKME